MKFLNEEESISKILLKKLNESKDLKEDAWDDNFTINMIDKDRVYWKRKSDEKEIITSLDIFSKPTDPTEWKSEEELNQYALNENLSESIDTSEYTHKDSKFKYMLLDRLKQDCEYFLGNGNGAEKHLWAGNIDDQIKLMKDLYNSFSDDQKPEWISIEDIEKYEEEMKSYNKN